jgi:hypothetical protein
MTSTDTSTTSLTMPATAEAASRYQRLRGHLAALKLHAAAVALPTVIDQAAAPIPQGFPHCEPTGKKCLTWRFIR